MFKNLKYFLNKQMFEEHHCENKFYSMRKCLLWTDQHIYLDLFVANQLSNDWHVAPLGHIPDTEPTGETIAFMEWPSSVKRSKQKRRKTE